MMIETHIHKQFMTAEMLKLVKFPVVVGGEFPISIRGVPLGHGIIKEIIPGVGDLYLVKVEVDDEQWAEMLRMAAK